MLTNVSVFFCTLSKEGGEVYVACVRGLQLRVEYPRRVHPTVLRIQPRAAWETGVGSRTGFTPPQSGLLGDLDRYASSNCVMEFAAGIGSHAVSAHYPELPIKCNQIRKGHAKRRILCHFLAGAGGPWKSSPTRKEFSVRPVECLVKVQCRITMLRSDELKCRDETRLARRDTVGPLAHNAIRRSDTQDPMREATLPSTGPRGHWQLHSSPQTRMTRSCVAMLRYDTAVSASALITPCEMA